MCLCIGMDFKPAPQGQASEKSRKKVPKRLHQTGYHIFQKQQKNDPGESGLFYCDAVYLKV